MTERVFGTVPGCREARSVRLEALSGWPSRGERALAGGVGALVCVLLCVCAASLCRAQVEAGVPGPWLHIDAAGDRCLASDDLRTEIERLLDGRRPARVTARARASGGGWTLELRHATGQLALREFPVLPADCTERLRALALVTVLAVEHAIDARSVADNEAPERPRPLLRWSLGLATGVSLGELPGAAPVLGMNARIERGMWVPLELLAFADVRASSQAVLAGAELVTRQVTAGLASCLGGMPAAWRIDGCLGVELGAVFGDAASLPQSARDTAGSGALTLAVAARWAPRPHLGVTARVEGFVRFWVPAFQVLDAEGDLFAEQRLPPAGGRLWLGLSWLSR